MKEELSTTCKDDTCCSPAVATADTTQESVRPHYEVERSDEGFRLRVYVPGSNKSDVDVSIDSGLLKLHAKRSDTPAEGWKPLRRELRRHDYRLEVRVPEKVDVGNISAAVEDGILLLTLPIREEEKPRSIEVR